MAVSDDLNQLAQLNVVYLISDDSWGPTTIYRGRLHQALNGDWVFNTSAGLNGVIGIILGEQLPTWSSSNYPESGLQVTIQGGITIPTSTGGTQVIPTTITLTSVIPQDLAD